MRRGRSAGDAAGHDLTAEDLELLARSAYLTGRDADWEEAWARAHQAFQERGDAERAARSAFWLGLVLFNRGEGRVLDVAERFDDPELRALGRLGRGQALVEMRESERAVRLLDEAMWPCRPARSRRSWPGSSTAPSSCAARGSST